jgi:filamentous hemagglutinin family protein
MKWFRDRAVLPVLLPLLAGTMPTLAQAQSIISAPDGTGSVVNQIGNTFSITGGTAAGANLFHSFQQFGLSQGEIASFLSNPSIQNILGRVTGGDASVINGLLQVIGGNSNLYLLNPAGIIFGANASLNVPAAFTATTANGIGFGCVASGAGCGGWFNATGLNDYSTLTAVPNTFAFSALQPGAILNAGNLSVRQGQNLTLLGGTVVNTGILSAPGGNLTVAAVPGQTLVRLTPPDSLLSLEFSPLPPLSPSPLSPPSLPQLLTGGNLGNATGLTVQPDGSVQLVGSELQVRSGDVVAGTVTAGTAILAATRDLTIAPASNLQTTGNLTLLAGDTVRIRDSLTSPVRPQAGGRLLIQGNQGIDTFALNHPASGLIAGGDLILRSPSPVIADAHYSAGGNFRVEKLDGSLGSLFSPTDPIVRASGDVSFASYRGFSLHILAGGSVTVTGDITIIGSDTASGLVETVTLSDGSSLAIDGRLRPTLDIRAGTTAFGTAGITGITGGFTPVPGTGGTGSSADITIGSITFGGGRADNGQVFLSNQYVPNAALPSGRIQVGAISTGDPNGGGDVVIDARGAILTGAIDTSSISDNGDAIAGDVRLLSNSSITFNTITTQAIADPGFTATPGQVSLLANGTVRGTGNLGGNTINTQAIEGRTLGTGGAITIRHDGGVDNAPFSIGDASVNGTAAAITSGNVTSPVGDRFPNPGIETRGATPATNGITVNFINTPPSLTAVSQLTATANQPLQLTFADLQTLVNDANGDNTSIQIAAITAGSLSRNGATLAAGDILQPGDVVTYTPPANVVGAIAAFSLQASDRVSTSAPVPITVNAALFQVQSPTAPTPGPPPIPPQAYPFAQIPFVQLFDSPFLLRDPLPQSPFLVGLLFFPGIIPEPLFPLPTFEAVGFPGIGLDFPGFPGLTSLPPNSVLYSGSYNPAKPTVLPIVIGPIGPNVPPGTTTTAPGLSIQPNQPQVARSGTGTGQPAPGTPGNVQGNAQAQALAGLQDCQQQVEVLKKTKPANRKQGVYTALIECNRKNLGVAKETGNAALTIYSLNNLAIASYVTGDYLKAIDYHQQQIKAAQEIKDTVGEGIALSGIGAAYGALGDYQTAIQYYTQALALITTTPALQWRALTLRNLGNAYLNQGDSQKAIEYQQKSLEISKQIGDRYGEAQALGNLGNTYAIAGEFVRAIEQQQQALKLAREVGDLLQEAQALLGLGTAYTYQRDFATAIGYHQQSLALARELQARLGEGIALNNLGDSLFRLQRLVEAETALLDGVTVWDSLRAGLGNNDAFKVSIFETQLQTYRNLQEVLSAQNKVSPALEVAERGRARAFVELLARRLETGTSQPPTAITPPNIEQIRQTAIAQNATLVQYTVIRDQFVEAPHGGSLQFIAEPKETELFIWVIKPSGEVGFRRVDLKPLLQQDLSLNKLVAAGRCLAQTRACRTLVRSVRGIGVVGTPEPETEQPAPTVEATKTNPALQRLHQVLIQPIADLLPSDPNARVVFIPQESLFLVPFPALQDASGKYLVQQHTILTAPAIQVLDLTRQQRVRLANKSRTPNAQVQTLVVGNPTMPVVSSAPGQPPEQLAALPGAEQEAKQIAGLLKTQPIIGAQATKVSIEQQLPNAQIIHLATHGLLEYGTQRGRVSLQGIGVPGAIALAPSGNDDGLLTSGEILNLNLNAELVVLSACDTGQGRITGDGVIGLSRAFISAGVPSVLVSLWSVPDAPTAQLMVAFYQNLQRSPDKAQALRQAMLTTMQQYPNPLDWAAFTLIGEAE